MHARSRSHLPERRRSARVGQWPRAMPLLAAGLLCAKGPALLSAEADPMTSPPEHTTSVFLIQDFVEEGLLTSEETLLWEAAVALSEHWAAEAHAVLPLRSSPQDVQRFYAGLVAERELVDGLALSIASGALAYPRALPGDPKASWEASAGVGYSLFEGFLAEAAVTYDLVLEEWIIEAGAAYAWALTDSLELAVGAAAGSFSAVEGASHTYTTGGAELGYTMGAHTLALQIQGWTTSGAGAADEGDRISYGLGYTHAF